MDRQQIKDKVREEYLNHCKKFDSYCHGCEYEDYDDTMICQREYLLDIIADLTIKLESEQEKSKEMLEALILCHTISESTKCKDCSYDCEERNICEYFITKDIIEKITGKTIQETLNAKNNN